MTQMTKHLNYHKPALETLHWSVKHFNKHLTASNRNVPNNQTTHPVKQKLSIGPATQRFKLTCYMKTSP